jgi:hypothetical protein
MPLTSAEKKARRKVAQEKLGRTRKDDYFTPQEWEAVKELVAAMRSKAMKKKVVYEGYYGTSDLAGLKEDWGQYEIAGIPNLHKNRHNKNYWTDGLPGKKAKITIEEI